MKGEKGEKGDTPEIDYEAIIKGVLSRLPKQETPEVTIEFQVDKNRDGFINDNGKLTPIPKADTSISASQEVFRVIARPPEPHKIYVDGLTVNQN